MKAETLDVLRCPYCGGRLELVDSLPHRHEGERLADGLLGCHCCLFPVVAGIPVLHLEPEAVAAREALEVGGFGRALEAMIALDDPARAARFLEVADSPASTYRELVETLGEGFEGGYFLHRFSDPSYVVASAVVGAVAGTVLKGGGRAIDLCGGSGHLTRALLGLSRPAPVVADLWFPKLWLATRFVAPGCEPVCCDGNAPLPFARGTFGLALCADAFMFIWTKRQMVAEMARLVDREEPGAVVITHAHNALVWSPSHGQPLPPDGYRDLFETLPARLFPEGALLDQVVAEGPLDLARAEQAEELAADPALVIVASRDPAVYRAHPLWTGPAPGGVLGLNPLYQAEREGGGLRLRLRFPSEEYEEEFGACRRYLEDEVWLDEPTMAAVREGGRTPVVIDLIQRRVLLDLPERYG